MLKKLFKALITLALLVGFYFGYIHAFAIVVEQLRATKRTDHFAFAIKDSKSRQESIRYAIESCGADHWATAQDLAYRYYNAERRYWIYAKDCERIVEENGVRYDGKRLRLTPFLLISKSSDGKSTKIITSDVAVFDLNEPLSFNVTSSAQPLKIKHARLEPNVWVRDDKGTPGDQSDDMKIGPLTTVDYEESTQQITTQLDTYVVIKDPEMSATAYGLIMQLRKTEALAPGGSSGFEGVERVDLLKNVHVVLRDVGKSEMVPGGKKGAADKAAVSRNATAKPGSKDLTATAAAEPVPLDIRCDSKMQVYMPKPKRPVLVGPPAPPVPTLVQFERNVVVLRGKPDTKPDQLTCDTLKLSLVPSEKLDQPLTAGTKGSPAQSDLAATPSTVGTGNSPELQTAATTARSAAAPGGKGDESPLGGLTLERVHATGHAVWLYLPAQGIKLVCNELIHVRQLPFKPDQTYFRGDRTRPLQLEKIDVVEEEGPDKGKITSVTNGWMSDATMFDSGFGMDATNIVAHGPGRLETRRDRDQPVERIAIWQDRLIVQNQLDDNKEVVHKIVDLVGNRPCFIDSLQSTRLDSGSWIQLWLKPKPPAPELAQAASPAKITAANARALTERGSPLSVASAQPDLTAADTDENAKPKTPRGGGLQVEKMHARVDVHLIAPGKTMTARDLLDAEFVDAEPEKVASTREEPRRDATSDTSSSVDSATDSEQTQPAPETQVAAAPSPPKEPAEDEPPMIGSCDRLWARIALTPKPAAAKQSTEETTADLTRAPGRKPSGEMNADIRKVWMFGNVALHQDPKKPKDNDKNASADRKGQDASGEAIYFDNLGPNKAISYVYQRDPTETTWLPGPLPPARVADDGKEIKGAREIKINQASDQIWVYGPGTLTQMAARGFMSDQSAAEQRSGSTARTDGDGDSPAPGADADRSTRTRTTGFVAQTDANRDTIAKPASPKPATRAGRPATEKVPMTIRFSENMEFNGRSVDPEGKPAAQAEFYGIVTAQMEDALLHCTKKMIAYTDREVPLAQIGKLSKDKSKTKSDDNAADAPEEEKSQAELTLLFCYKNAIAISRKVDPDTPTLVQKQRIEAVEFLAYDRRTGDFFVPSKGKVYLYDRNDGSAQTDQPGVSSDGTVKQTASGPLTPTQRTVNTASDRPTSGRATAARGPRPNSRGTANRKGRSPAQSAKPNDELPLTLIQIHFNKGMRGQFGAGAENDKSERSWSEFYGDIETARAKVATDWTMLNFDRLPADAMFLTAQTLLVTQEPAPVGAPESAPSRYHMKAWENVNTSTGDKFLTSDVMTYDSDKDLIYAYGKDGHGVNVAEQHAVGQPITSGSAKAYQLNPKTGGLRAIDSDAIQLIDKSTGIRPSAAAPIDPFERKKKPPKKPFKLPTMNIERRGFTGQ